jgi:hypothetical protein
MAVVMARLPAVDSLGRDSDLTPGEKRDRYKSADLYLSLFFAQDRGVRRLVSLLVLLALCSCGGRDEGEAAAGGGDEEALSPRRLEALAYLAAYREPRPGGSGVVRDDPERRAPGLDLVVSSHRPGAVLMDAAGRVLHEWTLSLAAVAPEAPEPKDWWRRAVLLPGGDLLAIFDYQALVRLDRDSQVLWAAVGGYHHDAFVDPEGRTWALFSSPGAAGRQDFVRVLDERGRVERQISIGAALGRSPWAPLLRRRRKETGKGDLFHTNTLVPLDGRHAARLPALARGNLLISPRNLDAVAVLDPATERIVWLLTGLWEAQHTPSLLPGGGLLLFDNRGPAGRRSRVLEVDPLTQEVLWSWDGGEEELFSPVLGAAQGLVNGNVLVVDSVGGRVFEVARDGAVVWEYRNPHRIEDEGRVKVATLPHVERLPADAPLDWLPVSR